MLRSLKLVFALGLSVVLFACAGSSSDPKPAPQKSYSWNMIATGEGHTLGIDNGSTTAGDLYAWGYNAGGQLGDGTNLDKLVPTKILVDNSTGTGHLKWTMVSAGKDHSLAIADNGSLWAWGGNVFGQLGIGNNDNKSTPQIILVDNETGTGKLTWTAVATGIYYSIAIADNGSLWTWGYNEYGQLGIGSTTDMKTPQMIRVDNETATGYLKWTAVSAGENHVLALADNGSLWAWGANTQGQTGVQGKSVDCASVSYLKSPEIVWIDNGTGGMVNWNKVSAGGRFSFGFADNGSLMSWGSNGSGRLGIGKNEGELSCTKTTPLPVVVPAEIQTKGWDSVQAGRSHAIALSGDETIYAWGNNGYGQLGIGNTVSQVSPVKVGTFHRLFEFEKAAASGSTSYHSVIIGDNDLNFAAWVWGYNKSGQLGLGDKTNRLIPTPLGYVPPLVQNNVTLANP